MAMELSLELMDRGSYQVEMSDEGLMTDDIEECLKVVIQALRKCDLPAAELVAWCRDMLKKVDDDTHVLSDVLPTSERMASCCRLPIVADCGTGGELSEGIGGLVRALEQAGVAALCLEDARWPKSNSLLPGDGKPEAMSGGLNLLRTVIRRFALPELPRNQLKRRLDVAQIPFSHIRV